jgi:hypothetical protein
VHLPPSPSTASSCVPVYAAVNCQQLFLCSCCPHLARPAVKSVSVHAILNCQLLLMPPHYVSVHTTSHLPRPAVVFLFMPSSIVLLIMPPRYVYVHTTSHLPLRQSSFSYSCHPHLALPVDVIMFNPHLAMPADVFLFTHSLEHSIPSPFCSHPHLALPVDVFLFNPHLAMCSHPHLALPVDVFLFNPHPALPVDVCFCSHPYLSTASWQMSSARGGLSSTDPKRSCVGGGE